MLTGVKNALGFVVSKAPSGLQVAVKEQMEMLYWRLNRWKSGDVVYNGHYELCFTQVFGLEKSHYDGKRLLDIGCGPLGSLEWADNAIERVGADPLAEKYKRLHPGRFTMEFVRTGSEDMPFETDYFDVVSIFNALDHVEDVAAAAAEAERVLAPGGDLLLIVEVDHPPTLTEPHQLDEGVLDLFPRCEVISKRTVSVNADHNLYQSVFDAKPRSGPDEPGILIARLTKRRVPDA